MAADIVLLSRLNKSLSLSHVQFFTSGVVSSRSSAAAMDRRVYFHTRVRVGFLSDRKLKEND